VGTGFLVANNLILTNYHNIANVLGGGAPHLVSFVFDYRTDDGRDHEGPIAKLDLTGASAENPRPWLIDASKPSQEEETGSSHPDITATTSEDNLDFALVRLSTSPGAELLADGLVRGHFSLAPTDPPFEFPAGSALIIIGHPRQSAQSTKAGPQTFAIQPNASSARTPTARACSTVRTP